MVSPLRNCALQSAGRFDAAADRHADAEPGVLLREPAAIAQVRYDMATQACDTRNTVNTAARDIIDNQNQNSRAILDFLTQNKMRDLESANQELRLACFSGCTEQLPDLPAAPLPHPGLHHL